MAVPAALILLCAIMAGCGSGEARTIAMYPLAGDPARAPALFRQHGCVTCHRIPGVRGADADVGPPLDRVGRRSYLAGCVPNTPQNMYLWMRNPQEIDERTAMPDTGVSDAGARDIVSYLYALEQTR
jgi:cytochrome c1